MACPDSADDTEVDIELASISTGGERLHVLFPMVVNCAWKDLAVVFVLLRNVAAAVR